GASCDRGKAMPTFRPACVAGAFRDTGTRVPIHSPFDGEVVNEAALAGAADIEAAIAGAVAALAKTRKLATYERAAICRDIARGFAAPTEEMALSMFLEGGKPISDALAEMDRAVHCFETAA